MAEPAPGMPPVRVPSRLPELVKTAFDRAKASGDLTFYPTKVTIVDVNSVPFQLRFSPALADKPKAPKPDNPTTPSKPFDPFDDPSPALLVCHLPPAHNLVLNKFAVVPEHFILATAAYEPQDHLLGAADLAATYACISAYPDTGGGLFAFFNSGPHSGASQPHRHIQLLPVERMRDGLRGGEEDVSDANAARWDVLADTLLREGGQSPSVRLPLALFAARIGREADARQLHELYLGLYRAACRAVGVAAGGQQSGAQGAVKVEEQGAAKISYNLAMTRRHMVLCPRTAEGSTVHAAGGDGQQKVVGRLSLNGTLLAGTALVRSETEWDAVREDPEQLSAVLSKVGVAPAGDGVKWLNELIT